VLRYLICFIFPAIVLPTVIFWGRDRFISDGNCQCTGGRSLDGKKAEYDWFKSLPPYAVCSALTEITGCAK
jgi:hypothetical protein